MQYDRPTKKKLTEAIHSEVTLPISRRDHGTGLAGWIKYIIVRMDGST